MPQEEMVRVFARRWLPTVLGVIASIVFLAVGITSIFSSELVTSLARLFTIISDFLFQALSYLFIPLGYLAEGLIYVAQFILNLLRHVGLVKASQTGKLPAPPELPEPRELQVPAEAVLAMKWALFALLAIVVAFLFARAIIRYLSSRAQDDVEETHESLWSWEGFRADLRLLFSIVRQRFKRKRREVAPASRVPGWYIRDDIQSMSSIREIYQCLLWEAACAGMARQLHETPYEYARRLGKAVPDGSVPLGELTDLYVAIRYGEIEAEDYQVGHANNLWKVLKFLLRRPSETV